MARFNLREQSKLAGMPTPGAAFDATRRRTHPQYDPYAKRKHPDDLSEPRNSVEQTFALPDEDENEGYEQVEEGIIDNLNYDRTSRGVHDSSYYMDGPRTSGETYNGSLGDTPRSPIGSEQQAIDSNKPDYDNHPGRLPNGMMSEAPRPVKPFNRKSRLSYVDPMLWVHSHLARKDGKIED